MDGFKWLFGARLTPLRLARNLGLDLFDRSSVLKRLIMLHAAGLAFDHPEHGRRMSFDAPVPAELERLLAILRRP